MEELNFFQLTLCYMIFAVAGWLIEVIVYLCGRQHKLINRGFLFGPWLPIYGFGGLIVLKLSNLFTDNLVLTFLVCAGVGAGIEYITSWLLEKIFHMRWWDYSKTRKIHINGRVALLNTIGFGVGGCVVINWILPTIIRIINQIPPLWQEIIAIIFLILIIADAVVSIYANAKVKNMAIFSKIVGDPAGQIKKYAKHVIWQILTGSEKMAHATKKQIKKAKKQLKKQQKKLQKRQKDFSHDIQKRKNDFQKDIKRRGQALKDTITKNNSKK